MLEHEFAHTYKIEPQCKPVAHVVCLFLKIDTYIEKVHNEIYSF